MCNRYRTRKANAALWDEMQGWRETERFEEEDDAIEEAENEGFAPGTMGELF